MKNKKDGIALITVMCFLMVLAILGTVFSIAVGTHVRSSIHIADVESALYTAEAGAERGAAYVASDGSIPHSFSGTLGNSTYYVMITANTGVNNGTTVSGSISINPNNRSDFLFTLTLPGGQTIDKSALTEGYTGYRGPATSIRIQPKGAGNQNSLTVGGVLSVLSNEQTCLIESSSMMVLLLNDKVNNQGKSIGRWHIIISATGATVTKP